MLDKDMREPLFDFLEELYGKIRIIEEKVIMKSRADVLGVIDGAIVGCEIKSDSDSYQRLPDQIKDYDKYCDYSYLVIGKSHSVHAAEHIPDYWGIICISDDEIASDENIKILRKAQMCPKVKLSNQFQLLWRNELAQLLLINHLPKCTGKNKKEISKLLIEKVDNDLLREQFTEMLFERDYNIFDNGSTKASDNDTKKSEKTELNNTEKSDIIFRKRKNGVVAKKASSKRKKPPRPVGVTHVITGRRRTRRKNSK
ncbi:MAG: sce7726 family protein [Eubacterium sp.]|nr:sce7726 family protein [Eubacterium sp.]